MNIEIAEVVVLTEAERAEAVKAEPAVREAFRLLAERLDRSPFRHAREFVLEKLELTPLPLDELLSPRGAERLADELYQQLVRRMA